MSVGSRPAVFLHRDGTLASRREDLDDPADVLFLPGVVEALEALKRAGFALVVVANQSGIASGLYSEAQYRAVAARLTELLGAAAALDLMLHCPHDPDCTGPCTCRKPATGMHESAARSLGLDLARPWYVGDKVSDVLPAMTLRGHGIPVRTGFGLEHESRLPPSLASVDDVPAAARLMLGIMTAET